MITTWWQPTVKVSETRRTATQTRSQIKKENKTPGRWPGQKLEENKEGVLRNFCLQIVQKAKKRCAHWDRWGTRKPTLVQKSELESKATTRDDSIPVRDDPSETIRFRCETIRARRSDPVRDEAIRARYGAIRRDTRRFRCDTVRYRCETVRYGRYECDTDRFRRDTESQRPSACQTCNKRCLRGGHHY